MSPGVKGRTSERVGIAARGVNDEDVVFVAETGDENVKVEVVN